MLLNIFSPDKVSFNLRVDNVLVDVGKLTVMLKLGVEAFKIVVLVVLRTI